MFGAVWFWERYDSEKDSGIIPEWFASVDGVEWQKVKFIRDRVGHRVWSGDCDWCGIKDNLIPIEEEGDDDGGGVNDDDADEDDDDNCCQT